MAKTVDELIIKIQADTSDLRKQLNNIQGRLNATGKAGAMAFGTAAGAGGFGAALTKIPKSLLAVGAGLAVVTAGISKVASVGSGFEDLKDSLDTVFGGMKEGQRAMDRVMKFAQTTPFQIEDVTKAFIQLKSSGIDPSEDMLQAFADTASTSIDQLGAFEAMVRLVQRSAAGGLGLEEINMLDDRGIPATKMLTEALGKSRDELSKFGMTAEGAAIMVDALIEGMKEDFGGAMASKMDNLSTKTSNMTIAFKQLADAVFQSGLGDFLKGLADDLTRMANAIARTVRAMSGNETLEDRGITGSKEEQIAIVNKQIQAQREKIAKLQERLANASGQSAGGLKKLLRSAGAELDELLDIKAELAEPITITITEGFSPPQHLIDFFDTFKKLVKDSADPLEEINKQLGFLDEILANDKIMESFQVTEEVVQRVRGHLQELADEAGEVSTTMGEELQSAIASTANAFTNEFVNALLEGENALESFKNFSKRIVSQIIAAFLQMMVVNKILNAIFGAGTFTTASFGGGSGLGGISVTPGTGGSAGGGAAHSGAPMLVGERGPEIFIPNSAGRIMNGADSRSAMSGGGGITVVQNNNFALGVGATARAEVQKMLPQIAESSKMAVFEAAARGGAYRKGLLGGT